ncbi:MAG TPA: chorismate mutase, partial [Aminivibrio sp.]|nr:chorismate mutase [Aminivibrio sp.]
MDKGKLQHFREKIDTLDKQIAGLIAERAETAREIGRAK